jgi:hypothetical protein
MRICISCTVFETEILSLHWGNICIGVWIGDNLIDVYFNTVREKQAVMTHAVAGRGRRSVRDEEDVLDIAHDNPSHNTRHISSATGRLCLRASRRTVRQNRLYLFQVQPWQASQQGENISFYNFGDKCYARQCASAVAGHERRLCHGSSSLRRSHSGDSCRHYSWKTVFRQGLNLPSLKTRTSN